jgi:hypothetical protein
MSEWSGSRLQSGPRRFESGFGLQLPSTVELRRRTLAVLAADGQGAVVRSADRKSFAMINLDGGGPLWTRRTGGEVTLVANAVVVNDTDVGRLVAYDGAGGSVLIDVATQASVIGAGPAGVLLGQDRTVGILRFGGPTR